MELHPATQLKRTEKPQAPAEETCAVYRELAAFDSSKETDIFSPIRDGSSNKKISLSALHTTLKENMHFRPLAPPIQRRSMAPASWPPSAFRKQCTKGTSSRAIEIPKSGWRRMILLALIIGQTVMATYFMRDVLPYHGGQKVELAILGLFALLFLWVSAGFWTGMMGFVQLVTNSKRHFISRHRLNKNEMELKSRTAIVMPICNEEVSRVFAGLQATYRSLKETEELKSFDFYILSDSSNADCRVAEIHAWQEMCQKNKGDDHIFYRWRQHQIKRKSGNVADFCRRWGSKYEYMIVLDADSVMSGDCLNTLVRLMQANPGSGIIQTAPCTTGRDTLYARVQQFASRVYGPLFVAGLHFWQLGESHYWGHNAIIRIAPFMQHCALGRLPGRGPLSGEFFSHDFVEAALMRRAGWSVWIAYDLSGSYEESPSTLVEDIRRDRRWCYGNLMNFRLFPEPSFHPVHRAVFVTGAFSYISAPLWFLFLILSTVLLATHTLIEPTYFVFSNQLFPLWPEWNSDRALALFFVTAALLFAPKLLSFIWCLWHEPRLFGGPLKLAVSMITESMISALLAPIRMVFHTQFVCAALSGRPIGWKSPLRADAETGWLEATKWHGMQTLLGMAWAGLIYWLNPSLIWWWLPIVGPLSLSIPISVFSSRRNAGRLLRKLKLLLIPEEIETPQELRWTKLYEQSSSTQPGLIEAVVDPVVNITMTAHAKKRSNTKQKLATQCNQLIEATITGGATTLTAKQKLSLLNDPVTLSQLHIRLWSASKVHTDWHAEMAKCMASSSFSTS